MKQTQIIRLEPRTVQVQTGEGEDLRGIVLYFDTVTQADRIETRLGLVNDPMAYAEKIRASQQRAQVR